MLCVPDAIFTVPVFCSNPLPPVLYAYITLLQLQVIVHSCFRMSSQSTSLKSCFIHNKCHPECSQTTLIRERFVMGRVLFPSPWSMRPRLGRQGGVQTFCVRSNSLLNGKWRSAMPCVFPACTSYLTVSLSSSASWVLPVPPCWVPAHKTS